MSDDTENPQQPGTPDSVRAALNAVRAEVGKAVVGQEQAVSGMIVALLAGGHILLEGVPGVAKTLLVRTMAAALSIDTNRVQFTPDLMPGDVTGSMIYDAGRGEFEFRPGPVFTNLMLADEINRTPPKTQSALLEAMEERQVTVDGTSRPLPAPFMVAATQNPVEYEGTYPLPEAQLDRFLMKVVLPLPPREDEITVLERHAGGFDPRDLAAAGVRPVASPEDLAAGARAVRQVQLSPEIIGYVVDLARATRNAPSLQLGVSPRGATALMGTARAWAWLSGRDFVTPDDVKALARATLSHRVSLRPEAELEGVTAASVLESVLSSVPVPPLSAAMIIRGPVIGLVLLGLVPVVLWPDAAGLVAWLWLLGTTALVAVDAAMAPAPASLQLDRAPVSQVRLLEETSTTLTVTNPGSRRVRGLLRDAWVPSAGAARTRHTVDVPGGERRTLSTTLRPTRRGDRPAVGVTVRSHGPLGLAGRQRTVSVPGAVRSLPPFRSRRHLPSKLAQLRQLDGRSAVRTRGQGTEFDSLRDYVEGDDVRSIDWRATARRQHVVVRTWQPERDRRVILVLDTARLSAGRIGDEPRLDAAMDAALLVAALASRAGDRVDLIAGDRTVRARVGSRGGASRSGLLHEMVTAMAPLEPVLLETDWSMLAGAVTGLTRRRALVILLTPLEPAAIEEGLLPVLPTLTAHHRVVVASVADPELDRMRLDTSGVEQIYDAAAAERTISLRQRTSLALGQLGVSVLDEPPEELPVALADHYLALKAQGLL